jgi:stearoyl-CoA desaturase (Delta-9 desaturase)
MAVVTGVYHRYFSHKTYSTSRPIQFLLALSAGRRCRGARSGGPTTTATTTSTPTRRRTPTPPRPRFLVVAHRLDHEPAQFPDRLFEGARPRPLSRARVPEPLRRRGPAAFAFAIWGLGALLEAHAPGLGTNGWQMLVWGFFISTTALFHGTSCINSMAHLMGRRRYKTEDDSRNSFILAIITLGEGWHNNHHRYQSATRNGFSGGSSTSPTTCSGASRGRASSGAEAGPGRRARRGRALDHHESVAAATRAQHVHPEYSSLKRIVPAAAAIAVATVNATNPVMPRRLDAHEVHRDAGGAPRLHRIMTVHNA